MTAALRLLPTARKDTDTPPLPPRPIEGPSGSAPSATEEPVVVRRVTNDRVHFEGFIQIEMSRDDKSKLVRLFSTRFR